MQDVESYAFSKGWETKHHTSPSGECLQVKLCPFCGGGDHHDRWTFALKLDDGASVCKRGNCGWKGSFLELQRAMGDQPMRDSFKPTFYKSAKAPVKKYTKPKDATQERHEALLGNPNLLAYLTTTKSATKTNRGGKETIVQGRGFSLDTIKRFRLGMFVGTVAGYESTWIAIPYFKGGELVRTKYRTLAKDFGIDVGSEPVLFGIDDVQGDEATIVEGEFDALALAQCGVPNVVSVPDGCADLNWIDHNWEWLDRLTTIRIAVDFDEGGAGLEREIVNRLGRDRCVRVRFPHKDANACLQAGMAAEEVRALVDNAEPYPMEGLVRATDLYDGVFALYNNEKPFGVTTGWPELDAKLGGIRMGEVTVVTGPPGSGKSEFVSALLVNLAANDVKSVIAPFETKVEKVVRNMLSQRTGLPFYGQYRMEVETMQDAIAWLHDRIFFVSLEDEDQDWATVEQHFRYAVRRFGCKVCVADPMTMLLSQSGKDSERFDIDNIMRRGRRLVTGLDVHLIIVAHPKKLASDDAVAELYDINGSAGVRNLTWNGLSIWRNRKAEQDGRNEVKVYIKKNREFGSEGVVALEFDPMCKRYRTSNHVEPEKPRRSKPAVTPTSFYEPEPDPTPWTGTIVQELDP